MGVTHSSGFGQLGDAPQTSQQLLEQCLAFSKDSPLGMDLSWIFLPFLCKTLFGQGTATSLLSTDRDYSSRCSSACTGQGNGPKTSTRPLRIPSVPGSRDRAGIWHSQPHHKWLQDRARGHVAVPVPGQASQCGRGRVQPAVVQLSLAEPPQEALVG